MLIGTRNFAAAAGVDPTIGIAGIRIGWEKRTGPGVGPKSFQTAEAPSEVS